MKAKLSATVEPELLEFLDSLPGETRSEKLERVLEKFRQLQEESRLRAELGDHDEADEERLEREAWERTVAEAMWTE